MTQRVNCQYCNLALAGPGHLQRHYQTVHKKEIRREKQAKDKVLFSEQGCTIQEQTL